MQFWNGSVNFWRELPFRLIRLGWALVFGTIASVFLFPLLGWQGVVLGTTLGPLTFLAVLTDDQPIRPQLQRALWATASTTAMYLLFSAFSGDGNESSSSSKITVQLLLQPLLVDGAIQTWIQLVERAVEPSISRFMIRFHLVEPLATLSWWLIVIVHFVASLLICLVRSAATKERRIPTFLGWQRPSFSLISEGSLVEYRQALEIAVAVKSELLPITETQRSGLEVLKIWFTIIWVAFVRIITDDYFRVIRPTVFFVNWTKLGRLILAMIQAVIRLGVAMASVTFRASVETTICLGLYTLWYLDAHPDSNLDLAVKLGLFQIAIQALHYSGWQFINRTLEPILIGISAGTMIKLRVVFGKILVKFIEIFAKVTIKTTRYLTEEAESEKPKQVLLLPPRDISDATDVDATVVEITVVDEVQEVPTDATDV